MQISEGPDREGTSWSVPTASAVGEEIAVAQGGEAGWNQAWRGSLRAALSFLGNTGRRDFETLGSDVFVHPWRTKCLH